MIVVKLEIWPGGNEERAKEIGRTYIANDGSGSQDRGDYKVAVCRRGTTQVPCELFDEADAQIAGGLGVPRATRAGTVKDYPRLAYNVWRLITRSLLAAFPEERAPKGVRPQLDERVVHGMQCLADCWSKGDTGFFDRQAVTAALEWLDAAKAEQEGNV